MREPEGGKKAEVALTVEIVTSRIRLDDEEPGMMKFGAGSGRCFECTP